MGFEITAQSPQVTEKTHRPSSIWAHLGAEFCVRTKQLAHFVHCFSSVSNVTAVLNDSTSHCVVTG